MRRTVECEVIIFDLDTLTVTPAIDAEVEAQPGARYLLGQLPEGRWAVVTAGSAPVARHRLEAAGLPTPTTIVATDVAPSAADHRRAVDELGADPTFSLAVLSDVPSIGEARAAGCTVVTLAGAGEADELRQADHVVPSLSSVRLLGHHPILVIEVDILPEPG